MAFTELVRRRAQPHLVVDPPPPFRPIPALRGPEQLLIEIADIAASRLD